MADYKSKSKGELVKKLENAEKKDEKAKAENAKTTGRLTRIGANGATSITLGLLFKKKPAAKNIAGSPVGAQHIVAVLGLATAFMADDEMVQNVAEGVAQCGTTLATMPLGEKLAGVGKG